MGTNVIQGQEIQIITVTFVFNLLSFLRRSSDSRRTY